MDFNDITIRLKRIYSSIDARFDYDIDKHINIEKESTPTQKSIKVSFDKQTNESDALNKIVTIIDNLAKLKDHLRNRLFTNGVNPQIIENEINNSFHLQIVLDLSNQDKHGSPLTRTNRSNKNPQIENVESAMQLTSSQGQASFFIMDPITGEYKTQGDCKVVIMADILDDQKNKLMGIDELIDGAISQWERIIKKYNII